MRSIRSNRNGIARILGGKEMKRVAIPKKEINEAGHLYGDCFGVTLYLQIDPSQKWTITNQGGAPLITNRIDNLLKELVGE